MWQRRFSRRFPPCWHWTAGGSAGIWSHRADHGLRHGHISGCHLNPAVSFGLWVAGRFPAKELPAFIVAQVLGGIAAAALLYFIASGKPGFDLAASGLAANGYGEHSPGGLHPDLGVGL